MSGKHLTRADMEFLSALYERHMGVMYKTALELGVRDSADRDAVLHDALLRLPDKLDVLRGMNERARAAYLSSVVRYVVLHMLERRRIERRYMADAPVEELTALPDAASLEDDFVARETRRRRLRHMWEALDELPEGDRELLIEKYIDGKTDAELARQYGVRPESIPKKLTRAKRRARRIILGKEGGHEDE